MTHSPRRITRRQWLAGVGALSVTALAGDAFAFEPGRVTVSRHVVGAAGRLPPLRLVQLSDLHLRRVDRHAERIAEAVAELRPDVVLLTGDAVDRADALAPLSTFLGLLDAATPKLAILGNWEYWGGVDRAALASLYARHGGQLLRNASVLLTHGPAALRVVGLDDLVGGAPDYAAAMAGQPAVPNAPSVRNTLLLAHCPAQRDLIGATASASATAPPDGALVRLPQLMLSGHTHGGQVALGGWAPLRPRGSGRYVGGWYRDAGQVPLYVSRGLGTSVVHARFNAPPEVVFIEWHLAAA